MEDHDEPRHVIGEEMAAAAEAERRRSERGDGGQSPLPTASYDGWRGELGLVDPTSLPLDIAIADVCREFARTDDGDRAAVRRSISMDEFYTLLTFGRRSAVFGIRDQSAERVRDGLMAISMIEADRVDFRDILVVLSFLHHAAARVNADTSVLFHDAAAFAEPELAKLVTEFAARAPADQDLRAAWGHVEIETSNGAGFLGWGFRPYDPTYDLAATALDIARLLDVDAYQPGDPSIATDLPAVWLRHAGDPKLEEALGSIRAGATIHGRLRPTASPMHASQQLTIFLVDVRETRWAQRLMAMSSKPSESFVLLGIAEERLFCLAVARSFVQGAVAHETGESLSRLGPGIRTILRHHAAAQV